MVVAFADRILAREINAGEGFVHDRDRDVLLVFVRQKIAATQTHAHGFEITGTDRIGDGKREIALTPDG